MALTYDARFMHCLPVRRNVVVADAVLDDPRCLIFEQAKNREYAAQAVLEAMDW
jgi:N-succinyl-L-ornithine transcarbamylase